LTVSSSLNVSGPSTVNQLTVNNNTYILNNSSFISLTETTSRRTLLNNLTNITGLCVSNDFNYILASSSTGNYYKSSNGGITFTSATVLDISFSGCAMSSSGEYQILSCNRNPSNNYGAYISTNFGDTWTPKVLTSILTPSFDFVYPYINHDGSIFFVGNTSNNVGNTYDVTHYSIDEGETWVVFPDIGTGTIGRYSTVIYATNLYYSTSIANNNTLYFNINTFGQINNLVSLPILTASSNLQYVMYALSDGYLYLNSTGNTIANNFNRITSMYGTWLSYSIDSTGQYMAALMESVGLYISNNYGITWILVNNTEGYTWTYMTIQYPYIIGCTSSGSITLLTLYTQDLFTENGYSELNYATINNLTVNSSLNVSGPCTMNNLTCNQLNYTSLNPPISGGSGGWSGSAQSNLDMNGYNIYDSTGNVIINDNVNMNNLTISSSLNVSGQTTLNGVVTINNGFLTNLTNSYICNSVSNNSTGGSIITTTSQYGSITVNSSLNGAGTVSYFGMYNNFINSNSHIIATVNNPQVNVVIATPMYNDSGISRIRIVNNDVTSNYLGITNNNSLQINYFIIS
jgi:hypothetical protein